MSQSQSPQDRAQLQYEDEFKSWLLHPTTQKFHRVLKEWIQDRKDAWADGEMLSSFSHEQFIKEAVAKGYISACKDILDLEAGDLEEHE